MNNISNVRKYTSEFFKEYHLFSVNLDNLISVLKKQGYDLIEYSKTNNSESLSKLIETLKIENYILEGKAVTYKSKDTKIIFICEDLDNDEKLYALAHEEGHIFCGHLHDDNTLYSVEEERVANEFAHYILHPSILQKISIFIKCNKKISIATIFLALTTVLIITCTVHIATSFNNKPAYSKEYNGKFYITKSGTKYHREDCVYIQGRKTQVLTEKQLKSGKYEPCKVCLPDE